MVAEGIKGNGFAQRTATDISGGKSQFVQHVGSARNSAQPVGRQLGKV